MDAHAQNDGPGDGELLHQFVGTGSECAFNRLVTRYKGLVFNTCLRITEQRSLAEESANMTFAILARKAARLKGGTGLAGWLHRTATYEALKLVRAERRHRRKTHALGESKPAGSAPMMAQDDTDKWKLLAPHLDKAIEDLRKHDRDLLIDRYYSGQSLKAIAVQAGIAESTIQKRSQRALQKLSELLKKRSRSDVAVSTLAAGLTVSLSRTDAGAGGIPSLASTALTTSSTLSLTTLATHGFLVMSTTKNTLLTASAVLLLALVPLGLQRAAIADAREIARTLESKNESLRANAGLPKAASQMNAPRSMIGILTGPDPTGGRADAFDLEQLAEDLYEIDRQMSLKLIARVTSQLRRLQNLGSEQVAIILENTLSLNVSPKKRRELFISLVQMHQDNFPKAVIDPLARHLKEVSSEYRREDESALNLVLRNLAKKHPDYAVEWFNKADDDDFFEDKQQMPRPNWFRGHAMESLVGGLYKGDREKAVKFIGSLDEQQRLRAIRRISGHVLDSDDDRETILTMVSDLQQAPLQKAAYEAIAARVSLKWGLTDATADYIRALDLDQARTNGMLQAAAGVPSKEHTLSNQVHWLIAQVPDDDSHAGALLGIHSQSQPNWEEIDALITAQREAGASDAFVASYIKTSILNSREPARSVEWIATMKDADIRIQALRQLGLAQGAENLVKLSANVPALSKQDVDAAIATLDQSPDSSE